MVNKIRTALRVLRQGGIGGFYEVAMYRYFLPLGMRISRNWAKHWEEIRYWKCQAGGGKLDNSWYLRYFTVPFGLEKEDFEGKKILDIGCGPRGSLEWADNALERVGLDPLVLQYRKLGINSHKMTYVESNSEKIPFQDGHFDFVSCINALDHVDDVVATLNESVRVLRSGGRLLVMVDIGHEPTLSEPHTLQWNVLEPIYGSCRTLVSKRFEQHGGPTKSFEKGIELTPEDSESREGVLVAMLEKI